MVREIETRSAPLKSRATTLLLLLTLAMTVSRLGHAQDTTPERVPLPSTVGAPAASAAPTSPSAQPAPATATTQAVPAATEPAYPTPAPAPPASAPALPTATPTQAGPSPSTRAEPSPNRPAEPSSSKPVEKPPADSGLFLRIAFGGGLLFDRLSSEDMPLLFDDGTESSGVIEANLAGAAFALDVFVGAITSRGVSVGVTFQNQISPSTRSGDVRAAGIVAAEKLESTTLAVSLLGPAFDYYPRAWRGVHVQAAFGLAFVQGDEVRWETRGKLVSERSGSGAGVSLGTGYEWDANPHLSFGAYARVLYAGASNDSDGETTTWHDRLLVPALGVTMAFH